MTHQENVAESNDPLDEISSMLPTLHSSRFQADSTDSTTTTCAVDAVGEGQLRRVWGRWDFQQASQFLISTIDKAMVPQSESRRLSHCQACQHYRGIWARQRTWMDPAQTWNLHVYIIHTYTYYMYMIYVLYTSYIYIIDRSVASWVETFYCRSSSQSDATVASWDIFNMSGWLWVTFGTWKDFIPLVLPSGKLT